MTPLLSVRGVHAYYGRVAALKGVDLDVNAGEIVTMIGANGAGKSTLIMTICGKPHASEGAIVFDGRDITKLPTHEIARLKLAQSPEGRRIFSRMTVLENLQMGATVAEGADFVADLTRVLELFPRLKQRLNQRGGTLSGGEQQMLAIGRALMMRPRLLLLDEPSFGLAPLIVREIFGILKAINESEGMSMLLVEQNANLALDLADHAYLLETGAIVMGGEAALIAGNETVRRAYLGY
jgi:branched-chain amino acid transport system ATP-binding protein